MVEIQDHFKGKCGVISNYHFSFMILFLTIDIEIVQKNDD